MPMPIYYGYYTITKSGVVRRNKPGPGTWVGRVLQPYFPRGTLSRKGYVKLSIKGRDHTRSRSNSYWPGTTTNNNIRALRGPFLLGKKP